MNGNRNEGKPREECGVFAVYGHEEAARVAFFGLFALQHRGQESAGIASADGCQIWEHKGMGLASEVFGEEILVKLPGRLAIGHVRYSTTGSSVLSNAQPFLAAYLLYMRYKSPANNPASKPPVPGRTSTITARPASWSGPLKDCLILTSISDFFAKKRTSSFCANCKKSAACFSLSTLSRSC